MIRLTDASTERRDLLLALTFLLRKVSGKTKLQKLVFLLQEESGIERFRRAFSFEPYYYGPYSEQVMRTMAQLVREKLVQRDPYVTTAGGQERVGTAFELSADGAARATAYLGALSPTERQGLVTLATRFRFEPLPKILEYVYAKYPQMAIKSQWSGRVE